MANPYLLETIRRAAATNKLQIAALIGNLSRTVDILTADIEHEESPHGYLRPIRPDLPGVGAEPERAKK
jgi:hypothetical protein